jgi:ribosomal protein L37AE/L43A
MSNRRLTPEQRAQRAAMPRCPKCRSKSFSTKDYPDAVLHICRGCRFPWREAKEQAASVSTRVRSAFEKATARG